MKALPSLAVSLFFALLPRASRADSYKYSFHYSESGLYVNGAFNGTEIIDFTYTSPVFITTDTVATADTSYYYSAYDGAGFTDPLRVTFEPTQNHGVGEVELRGEHLTFGIAFGSAYPYQSAFAVGDHPCGTDCDWNITEIASPTVPSEPVSSAVPEPSTLVMLGTGLLGATGALRRRFQQR